MKFVLNIKHVSFLNKEKTMKKASTITWDTLCVDLIGKYQFTFKKRGKIFEIISKGDEKNKNDYKVRKVCLFTRSQND